MPEQCKQFLLHCNNCSNKWGASS